MARRIYKFTETVKKMPCEKEKSIKFKLSLLFKTKGF